MWQHIQGCIDQKTHEIMEGLYQKLNRKLDTLTKQISKHNSKQNTSKFQSRLINLTNIKFTKEQIQTPSLGPPNYAIEKEPKMYINELIVDTENAIRQLEPKIQNTYRHLAAKQIKHIITTNRSNVLHKRHQRSVNQLKKTLKNNNQTIVKADKTKAIVIIDKVTLKAKADNFITGNDIQRLNKDPTEIFQKQIHQAVQKCSLLIDKQAQKYQLNIKPKAPQLNVYIKTHKDNQPIRPVTNNTQAPFL
jgi:hypothetical protein